MRIGYLYNMQLLPPKGGGHIHALELLQGFIRHGHKVCVVDDPTLNDVANFPSTNAGLNAFVKSIDILYVRIDARLTRHWPTLNKVLELANDVSSVWEINSPADECYAYSWLGGSQHDAQENFLVRLKRRFHALRQTPSVWLEDRHRRKLARNVAAAICVSKSMQAYATQSLGIDNARVLPNGGPLIGKPEIALREAKRASTAFTVLYSGSAMYPWQGLNYLKEVIRLAATEAPAMRFVLAVNQRTNYLPTSENVTILESLDRDEILDAICGSDVGVALYPEYVWSPWGFHNSPMKLFEYMACMKPSLCSNIGQMKDLLTDGVDAVLCENIPREILDRLIELESDPDQCRAIGENAWQRVQDELNWAHNVEQTLQLLTVYANTSSTNDSPLSG